MNTYTLNETYFDIIDSPEKAYILGFLYADGNMNHGSIRMGLVESDKEILETINSLLGSNRPLYYSKERERGEYLCRPLYTLSITNKHMTESLKRCGVVANKTYILRFPGWLSEGLHSHFIRGYFDGDGSITKTSTTGTWGFSLAGNKEFLLGVQEIIIQKCNLNKVKLISSKNIHILSYGGSKQILRIFDYLYKDATIFLKRKRDKFLEVEVKEKEMPSMGDIIDQFHQTKTNTELAENLGVCYKTVYNKLKTVNLQRGFKTDGIDVENIIKLYTEDLKTAKEIGMMYDTTHTTIYKVLRKNGIKIRDSHSAVKRQKIEESHKDEIIRMYSIEELSTDRIAKHLGIKQMMVIKILRDNGVTLRDRYSVLKSVMEGQKEPVIELLKQGNTIIQVAEKYGVTEAVVRKFMRRWGITSKEIRRERKQSLIS